LIHKRKTAGILVEAAWSGLYIAGIVMGIGINVSQGSLPPSEVQLFPATCIEEQYGRTINRLQLLSSLLNNLQKWRNKLGSPQFFTEWEDHLAFRGQSVRIEDSQKPSIIGTEKGINKEGNLVLILENGMEMDFPVGDVHLRPTETSIAGGR
jgi:BirA family transcriptional regulator, biotin operon repressor / biotin---[acetyl-CoA-carboxylase] ligase